MDSKELSSSTETGSAGSGDGGAFQGNRHQPSSSGRTSPDQKRVKPQPVPGDLTSRLVKITLFFTFGTTVGIVSQMAVTRRPVNVGAGMGIGLAAALTCAYKDSESLQLSPSFLNNSRKFCNRFEHKLDTHSEQLADNSAGQERLEDKIERLGERVDTLPLAMTRLPTPAANTQGRLLSTSTQPENPPKETAPNGFSGDSHLNGNGRNNLGTGF
ncbi:MAG: hypothetical protein DCF15_22230 [Phormidesmis priestleyi]|uniref:Uncharacterized protein n=1 Tax=Phormidesmis priestleyi TaxID=268141 RepID=A0A2W4WG31_9CYAN|nr:MAG: hypothetical protein DCF15_22230 [Phormidesmis priestleyi]